jgi:hypothetical protein
MKLYTICSRLRPHDPLLQERRDSAVRLQEQKHTHLLVRVSGMTTCRQLMIGSGLVAIPYQIVHLYDELTSHPTSMTTNLYLSIPCITLVIEVIRQHTY